jgi:hypothetical protein
VVAGSVVQFLNRTAGQTYPGTGSRWSARKLAAELGVSKSTVQRILNAHGVRGGARPRTAEIDSGMAFLDRVTDLVGLYLNPPDRAVAFSTDERVRPNPFRAGNGTRMARTPARSRGAELLAFLQMTERETPTLLDVHLLVDAHFAPVPPEVQRWLNRRRRFHLHFLTSDRVGLTLIDRLIEGFSRRKNRPGASASAHRLKYALREHIRRDRESLRPFVWTAAMGDIRGAHGRRAIQQ